MDISIERAAATFSFIITFVIVLSFTVFYLSSKVVPRTNEIANTSLTVEDLSPIDSRNDFFDVDSIEWDTEGEELGEIPSLTE